MPERAPVVSWAEFQRLRPDLAEAGRRLLYQFGVGLLHPSPKRQDLHRDGRYALHCFPPDDNEDAFVVSGRAMLITDPSRLQQATAQFLAERQLVTAPGGFEAQDLFEFFLERCLWTQTSGHGDWDPRHTIWRAS